MQIPAARRRRLRLPVRPENPRQLRAQRRRPAGAAAHLRADHQPRARRPPRRHDDHPAHLPRQLQERLGRRRRLRAGRRGDVLDRRGRLLHGVRQRARGRLRATWLRASRQAGRSGSSYHQIRSHGKARGSPTSNWRGEQIHPAPGPVPVTAVRLLEHPSRQPAHRGRAVEKARARGPGRRTGMAVERFTGRREDDRLLTGQGRYTADWSLPGQLHGVFLRSDRAHALIKTINIAAARSSRGVEAVFTGEDVKHYKTPPPMVKYPIKVPRRDILALERVRHVGQEIALVVARSPAEAQDAAEKIEIEFEDLPAVVDAAKALAAGAQLLHEDVAENLAATFEYGDEKRAAEALAGAAHLTRVALESTRVSGTPMEPKACVAAYDAASDSYDVFASSQGLSMMMPNFVAITGVPADRIRLHARDVGGGFGIRSQAYPEYIALMHAAKALGRPVKWVGSRFETIVSDHHGRAIDLSGELGLDRDGRFVALRVHWICNMGAYLSQAGPIINAVNPSTHAINAYRIPALFGRHRLVLTNTTSVTAYRGAGRPGVSYLVERLVDEAARELGVDPVELRRRVAAVVGRPHRRAVGERL